MQLRLGAHAGVEPTNTSSNARHAQPVLRARAEGKKSPKPPSAAPYVKNKRVKRVTRLSSCFMAAYGQPSGTGGIRTLWQNFSEGFFIINRVK